MKPRTGFDWSRVTWGRPDAPVSALCSYCSGGISDTSVPLRLWRVDGSACQFCDDCMTTWWGMQPRPPVREDDWGPGLE